MSREHLFHDAYMEIEEVLVNKSMDKILIGKITNENKN